MKNFYPDKIDFPGVSKLFFSPDLKKQIAIASVILLLQFLNTHFLIAQVVIQQVVNGKVVISDPSSVKMTDGFHAVEGSAFHAFIGATQAQAGSTEVPSNIVSVAPAAGTPGNNFVKTITYQEPKTSIPTSAFRHIEEISYFDGLGRPVQTVSVGTSPLKNDIIQAVLYDGFGREIYKPLPYAAPDKTGNFRPNVTETTISSYYSNSAPVGVEPSGRAYTQIGYDNSPLNRVVSQTGPGDAWSSKPVVTNYLTNSASDVKGYAAGSLFVTEIIDEQGNKTREYKDKLGRVVQKSSYNGGIWLRTAYLYDDYSRLYCVVPPQAKDSSQTLLCYYYSYDSRDRMVEKRIPGGGIVSMVYDERDRLRCTQNSLQDMANEWSFIQYDELNRPVVSGIIKNYNKTAEQVKTALDAVTELNETRSTTEPAPYYGYKHQSFPTSTLTEVHSVTFYDDYAFITPLRLGDSLTSEKYDSTSYNISSFVDLTPTGRVTGTMTLVLSSTLELYAAPDQLLYATTYYDKYGNVLRAISEDHLKGKNIVTNQYEAVTFLLQKSMQQHYKGGRPLTLEKFMEYDHVGRIVATREKVNSQTEFTINAFKYNELGQLVTKYLHSENISGPRTFKQKVDNQYNIRGWLTKINDPALGSENDLFGMQLCYTSTAVMGNLSGTPAYNGNIAGMKWGIKDDSAVIKGFVFSYDSLNRVKTSNYAEGAALNTKTGYFNENVTSYDKNGNIKKLNRKYDNTLVDNLTYNYIANTNQIESITDAGTASALVDDYPGTSSAYKYDTSGNMISDGSRGVTFDYINTLNLPLMVDFGNNNRIFYHYSSSGAKLLKHVKKQDGTHDYTHYIGNVIYENGKLSYVISDEGRFVNTGTNASPVFEYEYNLKDHLGNTRVTFLTKTLPGNAIEITTTTDYYPFGLVMAQYNNNNITDYSENKYLYNGKEIQDDNLNGKFFGMLDYGARFYDPQIGRWHSVDPLAEKYLKYSPYAYVGNNPIIRIDPDGKRWNTFAEQDEAKRIEANQAKTSNSVAEQLASKHAEKANQAGQKVFENTYVKFEGKVGVYGISVAIPGATVDAEVGLAKNSVSAKPKGVSSTIKVGYAETKISTNLAGTTYSAELNTSLAQGTINAYYDGSANGSIKGPDAIANVQAGKAFSSATSDGDLGFGIKAWDLKAQIMVNVKAAGTWFTETIEAIGDYCSLQPQIKIGPNIKD